MAGDQLFSTLQEFRDIIVLANSDGTVVKLSDVARITFGPQTYGFAPVYDGKPAAGLGIFLLPGANALQVGQCGQSADGGTRQGYAAGVTWDVPYDTTPFITASITDVVKTLVEAIVPGVLRDAHFPAESAGHDHSHPGHSRRAAGHFRRSDAAAFHTQPADAVRHGAGHRHRRRRCDRGHRERRAHHGRGAPGAQGGHAQGHGQITGAIIAITVVLSAVFIPSALQPGAIGIIYSQFALTIAVSMGLSALLAMSFTPSLCAAILKPVHEQKKNRFFRWFDRTFEKTRHTYLGHIGSAVRHAPRWMAVFAIVVVLAGFLYTRLPTSFVPDEDQGAILCLVNLPSGATLQRTDHVMTEIRSRLMHSPIGDSIAHIFQPEGFSFIGTSENVGIVFIKLKTWSARSQTAMQLIPRINRLMSDLPDAQVFATDPPTIRGVEPVRRRRRHVPAGPHRTVAGAIGSSRPDAACRRGKGSLAFRYPAEFAAERATTGNQGRPESGSDHRSFPHRRVQHHPDGAGATLRESVHVRGPGQEGLRSGRRALPDGTRCLRSSVHAQRNISPASGAAGTSADATNASGYLTPIDPSAANSSISPYNMIPLSSLVKTNWDLGPLVLPRYDGYSAIEIVGNPAAGHSTGQAMQTLQSIINQKLPPGFDADWTGQSYQELLSGSSSMALMGLSIVVVFLCLGALYESWSIPVSVLLVVPLGLLGMLAFCLMRNVPNDIYFKIGLVTVIGLAAKNAILIVEFAVHGQKQGKSLYEAVMDAGKLRLRPILMTSMAFILGVFPLAISTEQAPHRGTRLAPA